MAGYIALLRGVNVGGNMLRMERLREICAEAGMKNARTYVQSGNVAFEGSGAAERWARTLEKKLEGETRLAVTVIVRTDAEMAEIVERNPFLREKTIDLGKLYVTFLEERPAKAGVERLGSLAAGADRFALVGSEIYLHCANGYGESKITNNVFEKALGVRATTRTWNTVLKLREMAP